MTTFRSKKRELDSALYTGMPWVAGRDASSHGRGRWFNPSRAHHLIKHLQQIRTGRVCADEQIRPAVCPYDRRPCRRPRCLSCRRPGVVLIAGLALAFDPHILLLSWSAERQETVATTSAATCRAAIDAISAGRWLADDPPAAMACRQGSAFPPGWDCIRGFNCGSRR